VAKGGEDVCDPLVENFDALFQVFQHAEVLADQEAMIIGHVTFKHSNQFGNVSTSDASMRARPALAH
jgi:hypothetical protein